MNLSGVSPSTFSYNYTNLSGTNGTLTRNWGPQSSVLLSNIDSLSFGLSQRNPSNNFMFYPAGTNTANAKLINVTWICSLPVSGTQIIDTDSIQTAKIVIRN